MVLVDDYTRHKWIYRLKTKDEYPLRLKQWLAMMGIPPDRIRSDFGGEILGEFMNGFLQVCAERNIHPKSRCLARANRMESPNELIARFWKWLVL